MKPSEKVAALKAKIEMYGITEEEIPQIIGELAAVIEHQCHAVEAMAITMKQVGALVNGINRQLAEKPKIIIPGSH